MLAHLTDPTTPANRARDARRERWNAALATGDPAIIEAARDAVLRDITVGIMNDTPNYRQAGWTPTDR